MDPKVKLPDTLSALLRLAVQDAQACEAQPERYTLDMGVWVEPVRDTCHVCMAGAVMVMSCNVEDTRFQSPCSMHPETGSKLLAIDMLRTGRLFRAAEYLGIDTVQHEADLDRVGRLIWRARIGPGGRADWDTYLAAADALEEVGL